ncbi:hypothetical protein IGI04_034251 [Brassica rapa subsp. trilocularis]|uniref:VQ domain-containing protein n=1 Tax=Brassica rapa subsp. trilocularis TaxID=1813537 RepID=A0ABQ7LAG4_BRACM|nr:hypothetical protein IGI04_034251 [Brassica rapa subsp. trilocularis]
MKPESHRRNDPDSIVYRFRDSVALQSHFRRLTNETQTNSASIRSEPDASKDNHLTTKLQPFCNTETQISDRKILHLKLNNQRTPPRFQYSGNEFKTLIFKLV